MMDLGLRVTVATAIMIAAMAAAPRASAADGARLAPDSGPLPESVKRLPSPNAGSPDPTGAINLPAPAGDQAGDAQIPDPSIARMLPPALADPGGLRRSLGAVGITYGINYIGEVFGNASGGLRQGALYDGLTEFVLDIDFGRSTRLKGLSFHSTVYDIHGRSITGENVGSIAAITDIEAFPSTRLFEAWFEQKFFGDKFSLRFGQLAADEEFLNSDGGGAFIASAFGWPTITSENIPFGGPIYPLATPGVRLKYEPSEHWAFLAGLYNGDPVGPCPDELDPGQCNEHGLEFRTEDPPLLVLEAQHKYGGGPRSALLPGTIRLGGFHHFGDFEDQRFDTNGVSLASIASNGVPQQIDGNYVVYGVIDQQIYRLPGGDEGKGVSAFGRVIFGPSDRNEIDIAFDAGLVFSGLIPHRRDDVVGVAVFYTGISDSASGLDRDFGLLVIRDYEVGTELSYTAQIVPGLNLQPNLKYIWHPGGNVPDESGFRAVDDVAVFGLRTTISY